MYQLQVICIFLLRLEQREDREAGSLFGIFCMFGSRKTDHVFLEWSDEGIFRLVPRGR